MVTGKKSELSQKENFGLLRKLPDSWKTYSYMPFSLMIVLPPQSYFIIW